MRNNEEAQAGDLPDELADDPVIDTWTDRDQEALAHSAEVLVPQLHVILDDFYRWLLPTKIGRRFLDAGRVERLKHLQIQYWRQFFFSNVDSQYRESRIAVAAAHTEINLPLSAYLRAQRQMEDLFARYLGLELGDSERFDAGIGAIRKLIEIDTALTVDAYGGFAGEAARQRTVFMGDAAEAIHQLSHGTTPDLPEAQTADQKILVEVLTSASRTLSEFSRRVELVALGNYNEDVSPRDENDSLGIALQSMTGALREISVLAEAIASGDLTRKLPVKGDQDLLAHSINKMVDTLDQVSAQADRIANGDYRQDITPRSAQDSLGFALQAMTSALRQGQEARRSQEWLRNGINSLNERMVGDQEPEQLAQGLINFLANYLSAQTGALYLQEDTDTLRLAASYAFSKDREPGAKLRFGEGLVGQAAQEQEIVSVEDLPPLYMPIRSSLGSVESCHVIICPLLYGTDVIGVFELGSFRRFSEEMREFISLSRESIGLAMQSARARQQIRGLLTNSQAQAVALEAANEELSQTTNQLLGSEEELRQQQEKLEAANVELETTNHTLERQQASLEQANQLLQNSRAAVEAKAEEAATASRYKSEFIANMSHELRTPLNSILLLASVLAENRAGNLNEEQIESAQIITNSGNDLLALINEILDLSKVEAGHIELKLDTVTTENIKQRVLRNFRHIAEEKGLDLTISLAVDIPDSIETDPDRLDQILKNLVSNAIKFTESGSVAVVIDRADTTRLWHASPSDQRTFMSIEVSDTGIGIPPEKQEIIFHPFSQGDGGTARKFGGTGLGLSISEKLATGLGGELQLTRSDGSGSAFSLYLPITGTSGKRPSTEPPRAQRRHATEPTETTPALSDATAFNDDRDALAEGDEVVLAIEDDPHFGRLIRRECHRRGLKCLLAPTGESGLALAGTHRPVAIILDIRLPGIDGWEVLETLKGQHLTRHIPVHFISVDPAESRAFHKGAVGFVSKPLEASQLGQVFERLQQVSRQVMKNLLVVEDDVNLRRGITALVGNGDVVCHEAASAKAALEALRGGSFDCLVLDIGLPDLSGFELLDDLVGEGITIPPVVIYTGRELTRDEDRRLRDYSDSIILKGARSQERLFDEVALFLHRVVDDMPEHKKAIIKTLYDADQPLVDKKVLLVDDDMRNVFALSQLLRERGMEVVRAENGLRAIDALENHPDIDLVLMDIMMPEMDGYEAIERIRATERHSRLPIIALTAKAMKGDRDKAIALGANDYQTKPIDFPRLCSMMRIWLQR